MSMVTIETPSGGKRTMTGKDAVAFLLIRRQDTFEVMVNGELWTRFNRERGLDEGMNYEEYKVSPYADLTEGDHDYDKDMEFLPAVEEDISSALGVK